MKEIKRGFTLIELPVVRKRAFTLIELLVVIAIIGILATVVILNVSNARVKAQDAKIKTDINTVARAIDMHIAMGSSMFGLTSSNAWYLKITNSLMSQFKDENGTILLAIAPIHPKSSSVYSWQTDYSYYYNYTPTNSVFDLLILSRNSSNTASYYYRWMNVTGSIVKTNYFGF